MQSFKELYWRYSLFVLILGLGVTIFIELTPFLGGVLGAKTIRLIGTRKQSTASPSSSDAARLRRHLRQAVR